MIAHLFWLSDVDLKKLQAYFWVNQSLCRTVILSGPSGGVAVEQTMTAAKF